MSTTIDNKIVSMKFDNSNFEKNVGTSMSTIDKLKAKLNFTGASKGLTDINTAAAKTDLSPIAKGAETVQLKISAMSIAAITALTNITNTAINTGKSMINALTLDPITSGFNEYETKMNSIQTIMTNTASKGTTMEQVTRVIDELNTYADKTIYNFAEMTRNIGTFTAAGVGLEESASAIQGIANLAAASGSTSLQASTAMYQLSQALATGTVKLMDWNSVVNAGMGGELFQNALKDTAREMGVAVDDIIAKNGSFRDSLQDGWLSADILNTTLNKFTKDGAANYAQAMVDSGKYTQEQADALLQQSVMMEDAATKVKTFTQLWSTLQESAQSGWGRTWEIIIGDFEIAKNFLTNISGAIGGMIEASADARNNLFDAAFNMAAVRPGDDTETLLSGRDLFQGAFLNSIIAFEKALNTIKGAWAKVFPPATAEQVYNIIRAINEFTEKLILTDDKADLLSNTLEGAFSILGLLYDVVSSLTKFGFKIFGENVDDVSDGILTLTSGIGKSITSFRDWTKSNDLINKGLDVTADVITAIIQKLSDLWIEFTKSEKTIEVVDKIQNGLENLGKSVSKLIGGEYDVTKFTETIGSINDISFESMSESFSKAKNEILSFFSDIDIESNSFVKSVERTFDDFGLSDAIGILTTAGFVTTLITMAKSVNDFVGVLAVLADGVSGLNGILNGVEDIVISFDKVVSAMAAKQKAEAVKTYAIAIAILAGSLVAISFIDADKLWSSVGAIAALAGILIVLSFAMGKLNQFGLQGDQIKGMLSLVGVTTAVLVLVTAIQKVQDLDPDRLFESFLYILTLLGAVSAVVMVLGKNAEANSKASMAILAMVIGVYGLVLAIEKLNDLDYDETKRSLLVLAQLLGMLMISFVIISKFGMGMSKVGVSILAITAAMILLGVAIKAISLISFEEAIKSLTIMGSFLVLFGVTMILIGNSGQYASKAGIGILAMSAAIILLIASMKIIGTMDAAEITKGFVVISGILLIFGLITKWSETAGKHAIKAGIMLVAMSAAIGVLAAVIAVLSLIDPAGLARGTAAILSMLAMFSLVVIASKFAEKSTGSMLAISAAIAILATTIVILAHLPADGIKSATLALSGVMLSFSVLVASTKLISTASIGQFLLVLTGMGLAVGAITLLIGYLLNMPNSDNALIVAGALSLVLLSMSATLAILSVVGAAIAPAAIGIVALIAFTALLGTFVIGIGALFNEVSGLEDIFTTGLRILELLATGLGTALGGFIGGVLEGVSSGMPGIGTNLSQFMINAQPFFDGLKGIDPTMADAAVGIAAIILALTAADILDSMTSWLTGGVNFSEFGAQLVDYGKALQEFSKSVEGLDASIIQNAVDASKGLVELSNNLPNSGGVVGWFMGENDWGNFTDGLVDYGKTLVKYSLAVLGLDPKPIHNSVEASEGLVELANNLPNSGGVFGWFFGDNDWDSFSNGLVSFGHALYDYGVSVQGLAIDAITVSVTATENLVKVAEQIPNTGGLAAAFAGDNDFSTFGTNLLSYGKTLYDYGVAVLGINTNAIDTSVIATESLVNLASKIPKSGGFFSIFTGDEGLDTFGKNLVKYGEKIKEYGEAIAGVSLSNITTSIRATEKIVEIVDITEGLHDNNLGNFGDDMVSFGKDMAKFSDSIFDLDPVVLSNNVSAIQEVVSLAKSIANGDYTALESFGGSVLSMASEMSKGMGLSIDESISVIVSNLDNLMYTFTEGLAVKKAEMTVAIDNMLMEAMMTSVSNMTPTLLIQGAGITHQLGQGIISNSAAIGQSIQLVMNQTLMGTGSYNFTPVGYQISGQLGQGILSGSGQITGNLESVLSSLVSLAASKVFHFRTIGESFIIQMNSGASSKANTVTSTFSNLMTMITSLMNRQASNFRNSGTTMMSNLSAGINTGSNWVYNSMNSVSNGIIGSMSWLYNSSYTSGQNTTIGLANGIVDSAYIAVRSANYVANQVANAIDNTLDINSPSKVAFGSGGWFTTGLGDGILSMLSYAVGNAKKVGIGVQNGLNSALDNTTSSTPTIGGISDPVIKPVLDLSDIEKGVVYLKDMLGLTSSISASSVIAGEVSASMGSNSVGSTNQSDSHDLYEINIVTQASDGVSVAQEVKKVMDQITTGVVDKMTKTINIKNNMRGI